MLHASPDDTLRQHWHGAIAMLQSRAEVDYGVLRQVHSHGSEVISCYPSPAPLALVDQPGEASAERFAHRLLQQGSAMSIADTDQDATWDEIVERRAGFRAYWGEPLRWPDGEDFGCVELLRRAPADAQSALTIPPLLSCVATGIRAQLEVLQLRSDRTRAPLHDELTGLAGNTLFHEFTINHMQRAERSGGELWMLQWSIDNFAELRAACSDVDADALLRSCAEGSRNCIRRSDILARIDENRFAMLIGEASEFAASAVADRIRRKLNRIKVADGRPVTISCGLSPCGSNEPSEIWQRRCTDALDEAMGAGGNRVVVYVGPD